MRMGRCRGDGRAMKCALALVLAVALLAGCAGGSDEPNEPGAAGAGAIPVVVATDMSTDDILALLYLASRREVDLRAVVVSGAGLTTCPTGAANAAALLAAVGRSQVPVECGRREPLAGANGYPASWRDAADHVFGVELPPLDKASTADGVALLRRAITESPRKPVVLSLGPMTDIAALLEDDPVVEEWIARIVAMAGALEVPGNVTPGHEHAEWNAWVDPAAAAAVLRSGVEITLVPLDATNDVPATVSVADVLRREHAATSASTLAWDLFTKSGLGHGGQYFWDVLAAAAIVRPNLVEVRATEVDVVVRGPDAGRFVLRPGRRVLAAVEADRAAFERHVLTTLLGHSRYRHELGGGEATVTFEGTGCAFSGPRKVPAGDAVVTSVNRSDRTFRLVVARLEGGHDVIELAEALESQEGPLRAPAWLVPEWTGDTPPESEMTWVIPLSEPGSKVLGCTVGETAAWIAAPLVVD